MSTPLFTARHPLILASASPRRSDMLRSLGLDFTVQPSAVEEPDPSPSEAPSCYVTRLAQLKGEDIAAGCEPGSVVIAADTAVVLGTDILGKPRDEADALRMLTALSGAEHQVVSGCWLGTRTPEGPETLTRIVSTTTVTMAPYEEPTLRAYIATGEPMDKAGGYGIQGIGAFLVKDVQGSYSNVVGMPLAEVVEALVSCGVVG